MAIIKIARFWPGASRTAGAAAPAAQPEDLSAFGSEDAPGKTRGALALARSRDTAAPADGPALAGGRRIAPAARWFAVILLTAATAAAGMWGYQRRMLASPATSQLTLDTTPAGVEVRIAGELKGTTPLTLPLAPGMYDIQLGTGPQQRIVQAMMVAGVAMVQRVEVTPPPALATGALPGQTDPAGSAIGPTVPVNSNGTVSVASATTPAVVSAGWLSVASPVVAQILEDGKAIGSTDLERVMLPSGDHRLVLLNEALGYRAERRVTIAGGKVSRLELEAPNGALSINAQPWAEVWLDGRSLGPTPIGNLSASIGSHELVFRHPDLGERRETVVIGLKAPARVGVDMRKK